MNAPPTNPEGKVHGDVLSEISEGMVRILKEHYGTGPSEVKTVYDEDLVLCVLRGGFSRVEQVVHELGRGDDVARFRHAFQTVMEPRFRKVVEDATGRKVIAFMSGNDNEPNMLGEIFVLEPRPR